MRKWLVLFVFCLSNFAFSSPLQDHQIDPNALSLLASTLGIDEATDIVAETQKNWLRSSGKERWEMTELSLEQRNFVLNWAKEQGFFTAWQPIRKFYDKALIHGASTPAMQLRLTYLIQLWEEGTRFNEIVWLTGDRPLDARVDRLTDRCRTEVEAARVLWEEADLPDDMRALPVVFVAAPMTVEGSSVKRPNRGDTVTAWLKTAPEPCTALFVSNQPFCGYEFAVVKTCLPNAFLFDVVGKGVESISHPAAAALILDSIARWIYQEGLSL